MMHRFFPAACWAVVSLAPLPAQDGVREAPLAEVAEEVPVRRAEVIEADAEVDAAVEPGVATGAIPRAIPIEEAVPAAAPEEAEPLEVKAVPRGEEEPRTVKAVPGNPSAPAPSGGGERKAEKAKIAISLNTDPNARPLTLRVPAPRGQIVDRHGKALAQNRMAYYLGVQLPLQDGLGDAAVLAAAREPVAWARRTLPQGWDMSDEKIVEHYRKRRWVPLLSSSMVPDAVVEEVKDHLPAGVVLRPFYLRSYPRETMASHLIGYMGKSGSMASGDILADEYLWPPTLGKYGLEQRFDAELTGAPGTYSVLYNAGGDKLSEEWVQRPTAGHTVVTSLDSRFQAIVEQEMRSNKVRGAFVIMDVKTGDVIAMCSNPGYNPNDWAYGIGSADYNKYLVDPQNPLLPRALAGLYPPASTFKIVTALAALDSGKVGAGTEFNCPKGMMFGRTWMWNHSHRDEGSMDVVRAIKRSCNPWFWQAARISGAASVSAMAVKMGFGDKTGICLPSMEVSGTLPSPEYYEKRGRTMNGGVLANVAIGQGEVSATPLQVCQMMAAVARGDAVPRPRLVRQIQDINGRIVQSFPPSVRSALTIDKAALQAVRRGMRAVVADGDGTGTRAANEYVAMAGKTGTGEWHDSPKDYVAWFAGFVPSNNPEYAYAALYEGDPGDQISGGKLVAPIVGDVFNKIYKLKKDGKEIPEAKPSKEGSDKDAEEDAEADGPNEKAVTSNRRPRAAPAPVAEVAPAPAVVAPQTGVRGWWQRVRSGNKAARAAAVRQ